VHKDTVAMVSHDLRNPLCAIRFLADGFAKHLEKILSEGELARLQPLLKQLKGSSERCINMVENLLHLAKIESGSLALEKDRLAFSELAEESLSELRPVASAKGVSVRMVIPEEPMHVNCDKMKMYQVLSNLLGNAIKFNSQGGWVELRAVHTDREIKFTVEDNGPGIHPGALDHIFDRYWQEGESRAGGVGLGLSIAQGIVTAHGGRIWAESEIGSGSKFHFTLPIEH
jgi:signal transduction histidine kinase